MTLLLHSLFINKKIICIFHSLSLSLSLSLSYLNSLFCKIFISNKTDFRFKFYLLFVYLALDSIKHIILNIHDVLVPCAGAKKYFSIRSNMKGENVQLWTPTARDMIEWFSIFVACTSYVLKMNKCHIQLNTIRENKQNVRCILKPHIHLLPQFLVINIEKCLA